MGGVTRPRYRIRIVDLTGDRIQDTARLHAASFPDKIETLLGLDCIADVLRERFLGADRDSYCRIALSEPDGRLAGYLYSTKLWPDNRWSHAFINQAIFRRHFWRKVWLRPAIWRYLLKSVTGRFGKRVLNEREVEPFYPDTEVAKMLAVSPDFRGGNVGADLMRDIEPNAIERGARRLNGLIERNNIKAERLYKSIGWVRTSPDTDEFDVFAMHKILAPAQSQRDDQVAPISAG